MSGAAAGYHGDRLPVDKTVKDASRQGYDAVVVPGGVANGDLLRADEDAVRFVAAFAQDGKPIASICDGPWIRRRRHLGRRGGPRGSGPRVQPQAR